jgi:hypothetical protein
MMPWLLYSIQSMYVEGLARWCNHGSFMEQVLVRQTTRVPPPPSVETMPRAQHHSGTPINTTPTPMLCLTHPASQATRSLPPWHCKVPCTTDLGSAPPASHPLLPSPSQLYHLNKHISMAGQVFPALTVCLVVHELGTGLHDSWIHVLHMTLAATGCDSGV